VSGRPEEATITVGEMAELAGVTPAAVTNWRSRIPDFPPALDTESGDRRVARYDRETALQWMRDRGKLVSLEANFVRDICELMGRDESGDERRRRSSGRVVDQAEADEQFLAAAAAFSVASLLVLDQTAPELSGADSALAFARSELDALDDGARAQVEAAVVASVENHPDVQGLTDSIRTDFATFVNDATYHDSPSVRDLLVSVVDLADTLYDPCCGSGALLAQAARRLAAQRGSSDGQIVLLGQESVPGLAAGALALWLAEGFRAEMIVGDVLRHDGAGFLDIRSREMTLLADPPLAQQLTAPLDRDDPRWSDLEGSLTAPMGRPGATRSAMPAWIAHGRSYLPAPGRADLAGNRVAVVVRTAWLVASRSVTDPARARSLRRDLVESGELEAVIALPEGAAGGQRSTSAVIVLRPAIAHSSDGDADSDSRQRGSASNREILFVDLSDKQFTPTPMGPRLDSELIESTAAIVDQWRSGATAPAPPPSAIPHAAVSPQRVSEEGYSLLPNLYVAPAATHDDVPVPVDLDELVNRVAGLGVSLRIQQATAVEQAGADPLVRAGRVVTLAELESRGELQILVGQELVTAVTAATGSRSGLPVGQVVMFPMAGRNLGRPKVIDFAELRLSSQGTERRFGRGVSVFVCVSDELDEQFLAAWLASDVVQEDLDRYAQGSRERTSKSVPERVLRLLPGIVVPTLPTQRAVGELWGIAEQLAKSTRELLAALDHQRGLRLPRSLLVEDPEEK